MIRKGMWCVDAKGKVGIVNALGVTITRMEAGAMVKEFDPSLVEFHLIDKAGVTVKVEPRAATELIQARLREIPESRRTLSREQFAALGYN